MISRFSSFLNEQSESVYYTVDDVKEAFSNIESEIHDWYYLKDEEVEFDFDWNHDGAGGLNVEAKVINTPIDFDQSGFFRTLKSQLSVNPENKGPKFTIDEIERAIKEVYENDVFENIIKLEPRDIPTNLQVVSKGYTGKNYITIEASMEDEPFDMRDYDVDTDEIIGSIEEELLKGITRRIDYT